MIWPLTVVCVAATAQLARSSEISGQMFEQVAGLVKLRTQASTGRLRNLSLVGAGYCSPLYHHYFAGWFGALTGWCPESDIMTTLWPDMCYDKVNTNQQ